VDTPHDDLENPDNLEPGITKIMLPTPATEEHGPNNAPELAHPPQLTDTQQESTQVPEIPAQPTLRRSQRVQ